MSCFKTMDDRGLVSRLLANDRQAWEYVLLTVVMRMASEYKNGGMLFRRRYEPGDVVGEVYLDLAKDDFAKLRTFEFRGSFDGWLRTVVRSTVQRITGITGTKDQIQKADREVLMDSSDSTSVIGHAEQSVSSVDLHLRIMDKRSAFTKFWKEDPESAYIVFMRNELEMSANDVGALLGRPPNTIVQKGKRAHVRLRELEME